jgi:16S rRNA (adenine1518-N6/adenine1519-N6)-dimethyltransferase
MNAAHRPRKRFGQHFLDDNAVIADIVDAIDPRPGETVVEIGPGQGALTGLLQRSGVRLHAIEFDRDLAALLRSQFADADNVTIHEADALDFDFSNLGTDLRVVGNLPYNISTPLLFHLVAELPVIRDMHFMLQKEVVDRMGAEPGSKRYGRLTVMLGCHCIVEPLFDVSPDAFRPPPKVMSSVVRLTPRVKGDIEIDDEQALQRLVALAFSKRRKTLHNALKDAVADDELAAAGIDPGARAETVPVRQWVALANRVASRT